MGRFESRCRTVSEHLQRLQVIADGLDDGVTLIESRGGGLDSGDVELIALIVRQLSEAKLLIAQICHEELPEIESEEPSIAVALKIAVDELSTRIQNSQGDLNHHTAMTMLRSRKPKLQVVG